MIVSPEMKQQIDTVNAQAYRDGILDWRDLEIVNVVRPSRLLHVDDPMAGMPSTVSMPVVVWDAIKDLPQIDAVLVWLTRIMGTGQG